MRVLYIDIDTLRADHLGCYGYRRETSPNIDRLADSGVRFANCYVSDAPCLPSRTALFTGRFGIQTGVINHGGKQADLAHEGRGRGFFARLTGNTWAARMRRAGCYTTAISSFAERHSAYHAIAGFREIQNPGLFGQESAHDVIPLALDWLDRRGREDNWFCHVHTWDPHTPYRVPEAYGNPFADAAYPDWITDDVIARHRQGVGPHSAREVIGFGANADAYARFPRQPQEIVDQDSVRAMFDGYDTGIRYADDHVGQLLAKLAELGIADDTAIILSSDHGETLGELNVYCDHHLADEHTSHVPLIIRWPGTEGGRVDSALHYQFDMAATVLELIGGEVPSIWDGQSFADAFREGSDEGRDHLVLSQAAWTCQRSVRYRDRLYIRTYHDGYHEYPDDLLFDLTSDPHEQHDLATEIPEEALRAKGLLHDWTAEQMRHHPTGVDPMWSVLEEGGPFHIRDQLHGYIERLEGTGRAGLAAKLQDKWLARP